MYVLNDDGAGCTWTPRILVCSGGAVWVRRHLIRSESEDMSADVEWDHVALCSCQPHAPCGRRQATGVDARLYRIFRNNCSWVLYHRFIVPTSAGTAPGRAVAGRARLAAWGRSPAGRRGWKEMRAQHSPRTTQTLAHRPEGLWTLPQLHQLHTPQFTHVSPSHPSSVFTGAQ